MAKSDLAQKRETGSDKAQATCPNCGGEVPMLETPYGSTVAGACPQCWPQVDEESDSQLKAQQKAAADVPQSEDAAQ